MINAYAASKPRGTLEPYAYDPGELGRDQIEITVEHCGICHSDLSMLNNDWGMSGYPLVPGHEIVGTVAAVGGDVSYLTVGQQVGAGWHAGYCMTCGECLQGDHNLCADGIAMIAGHPVHQGGFADKVRVQATAAIALPAQLDKRTAGPLFCGGVTVYNPLVQFDVKPWHRVGVIGIGGLGHLALQFCKAWGCEVTAFTSKPDKRDELLALGATDTLDSTNADALADAAGKFDLLLSTVNVTLNWSAYLGTLSPRGRLHFVGGALEPMNISAMQLIGTQLTLSGSPVGSPATIADMLEFAARHDIAPQTEHYPLSDVNAALDHLRSGKARYRVVLDM
ncbi:MAG: NAD(P)-dependent alcohol dehydrogenase [Gammaproteobacteria bacterium]|nr:NAD(P)-dependent alcohol dehydrogenase [Gammaproteobacteria bacterium]